MSVTPASAQILQLTDLSAVLAVQALCYPAFFHESEAAFRAKLLASPDTHWGCWQHQQLLAYLVTVPIASRQLPALNAVAQVIPEQPEWLYVHDLAVHPAARALGLGKLCLQTAEQYVQQRRLRGLALVAVQQAAAYWARLGFQPVAVAAHSALAAKLASFGEGAVYMEKACADFAAGLSA